VIQNQKHNQNVHQHISEPALYVLYRFKESHEDCRKFVEQIQTLPARVAAMKSRHATCNKRAAADVPLMQDEMTQQEEEQEPSTWSHGGNRSPRE
jgi:hypothetical protein